MAKKKAQKRNPTARSATPPTQVKSNPGLKISACWIAKNEEKTLPRSIRSVSRLADELIVVDTGSSDGTTAAAASLNAKVFAFAWVDDFSAARNFALSKTSGDIIIFLDADEWFEPALSGKDRRVVETVFANQQIDCMRIKQTNIDEDTGEISTEGENIRIFRSSPAIRYAGRIHEAIRKEEGGKTLPLQNFTHMSWNFHHSGYSSGIFPEKMNRNIRLLDAALKETDDPYEAFLLHSYLLREHRVSCQDVYALTSLLNMLDHPEHFGAAYAAYGRGFLQRILNALNVAHLHRDKVSRKQVYDAVVKPAKAHYPLTEYTVIDLHYRIFFDSKPDAFLEAFAGLPAPLPSLRDETDAQYRQAILGVLQYAVSLYLALGEGDRAFDLLQHILQCPALYDPFTFAFLLDCLSAQPEESLIPYLAQVLDFSLSPTYALLGEALKRTQRRTAFLYFQKKQLDAGLLSKGDFLYLMLVNKQFTQFTELATAMEIPKEAPDLAAAVSRQLFLACVLQDQESNYLRFRDRLSPYRGVLDAYFAQTPLAEVSEEDALILMENYHLLAFAGGLEAADRFAAIYAAQPALCFSVRGRYYSDNHLDEALARLSLDVATLSTDDLHRLCRSLIRCGEHETCLSLLGDMLQNGLESEQLFRSLYVLTQKGRGGVAAQAKTLYDRHYALYDERIDALDLENAGSRPAE